MAVNFDNAATTYPKPRAVRQALADAAFAIGGNSGRGGHSISLSASEKVFDARQTAADFFGAKPENVVFTLNCTHALNFAIKGILAEGGHVIISSIEHNSVARPIFALSQNKKVSYSLADAGQGDDDFLETVRSLIRRDTKAIVMTAAGNVTGRIMPFGRIGKLCRENNICFIADGAQAAGIIPISLKDNINILCTAGHKGLYGPFGTGLLISDGKFPLKPLIEGGTGSTSMSLSQPEFLPDSLESGTLNIWGIIALKKGIDFVKETGIRKIYDYEESLCNMFIKGIKNRKTVIYRNDKENYCPIVSFNIKGISPEETADKLNSLGYCLRAGLHCAPLAHQTIKTPNGTVRFAPSLFNTKKQVSGIIKEIRKICENL